MWSNAFPFHYAKGLRTILISNHFLRSTEVSAHRERVLIVMRLITTDWALSNFGNSQLIRWNWTRWTLRNEWRIRQRHGIWVPLTAMWWSTRGQCHGQFGDDICFWNEYGQKMNVFLLSMNGDLGIDFMHQLRWRCSDFGRRDAWCCIIRGHLLRGIGVSI